jgi:hypothetical protein
MTALRLLLGMIVAGMSVAALGQTSPAPNVGANVPAASQATGTQGTSDAEKKSADRKEQPPVVQRRRNNPGGVPPSNIRLKDEGIALPRCVTESREGEACK